MRACTAFSTVRWEHGREARQPIGSIGKRGGRSGNREARCVHTDRKNLEDREIGKPANWHGASVFSAARGRCARK